NANDSYSGSLTQHHETFGSTGSAQVSLTADGNVKIGSGASILVNAAGNVYLDVIAGASGGSGNVDLDGDITVTTTAGSFTAITTTSSDGSVLSSNFAHTEGAEVYGSIAAYHASSLGSLGDV